jgi:hypothetical protein
MSSDTSFYATGPATTGFTTDGNNLTQGATMYGQEAGLIGICVGQNGIGVSGNGAGVSPGVKGWATSTAPGVIGIGGGGGPDSAPPATNAVGVFGQAGVGLYGNSDGVYGQASGAYSGVAGFADQYSTSGPGTGVFGMGGSSGCGVRGIGSGGNNTAPTNNGEPVAVGVYGQGGAGNADGVRGVGSGAFSGVAGYAGSSAGYGVYASGAGGTALYVEGASTLNGDVTVTGNFTVNGSKQAAVAVADGSLRGMYCMESPECWFEDFGETEFVDGQVEVRLDPDFTAITHIDSYHVFITEYDDNNGLYVTDRKNEGFTVRAKSSDTAHGAFSYRVVAKRKDVEAPRFLAVTPPG